MQTKRWTIVFSVAALLLTLLTLAAPPALAQSAAGEGLGGPRLRLARAVFRIAAKEIGLTPRELLQEMRQDGGRSIAQVAEDHGVEPHAVVEAVMDKASEKLAKLVEKGWLTQEEADEKLATMRERVTEFINKPLPARFQGNPSGPQQPGNE
ncbi:MAG: hypothetical protein DPW09_24015 [Anaerolineae bacterium]|nr:hypothetical protein [Anaerolineales bacterium]MCQ3976510.1 hypothetical protein [Anaerolineae bacterium]